MGRIRYVIVIRTLISELLAGGRKKVYEFVSQQIVFASLWIDADPPFERLSMSLFPSKLCLLRSPLFFYPYIKRFLVCHPGIQPQTGNFQTTSLKPQLAINSVLRWHPSGPNLPTHLLSSGW